MKIRISHKIPVPRGAATGSRSPITEAIRRMGDGDSIVVSGKSENAAYLSAYKVVRRERKGFSIVIRKANSKQFRLWLVAKPASKKGRKSLPVARG